jgi:hypothetical protein
MFKSSAVTVLERDRSKPEQAGAYKKNLGKKQVVETCTSANGSTGHSYLVSDDKNQLNLKKKSTQLTAVKAQLPLFKFLDWTRREVTSKTSQRVTKKCRLSWLTNRALVYEPSTNEGGVSCGCGVSANGYSCAHRGQIIFGDLTPRSHLAYDNIISDAWIRTCLHRY